MGNPLYLVTLLLLLAYIGVREAFYLFTVNKLVNKLMSRNYHDYEFAKNVDKTMQQENGQDLQFKMRAEQDLEEDLAPVQSFMG